MDTRLKFNAEVAKNHRTKNSESAGDWMSFLGCSKEVRKARVSAELVLKVAIMLRIPADFDGC